MNYLIDAPETIRAMVKLPASKSISNRVLILNALSRKESSITNLAECDDTDVMVKALHSESDIVDIGAAGTAMRFLTAYYSMKPGERTLTGSARMKNRPIGLLVEALRSIGAKIDYKEKEGFPPLYISGRKLHGGEVTIAGNVSSQYISALLMIAPMTEVGLRIHLQGEVVSKPYIHLTIELMKQFGVDAHVEGQTINVPANSYDAKPFTVESDWSAASYWYAMAAMDPKAEIELLGLFEKSLQGDSKGAEIFEKLGVSSLYEAEKVRLLPIYNKVEKRFEYDYSDQPDLVQTFALTCAMMQLPFRFTGVESLRIKETDRIKALQTELKKLGFVLRCDEESMEWNGEHCVADASPLIETYEDHRMAMAFACAATRRKGIRIHHPEVVSKSYPRFWDDLKSAGFRITEEND